MTRSRSLTCILLIYFANLTYCHVIFVSDDVHSFDRHRSEDPIPVSTNKVSLVKRLVPHSYKTPEFEYDRKYKTIFAPKYRVQKRRPTHNEESELYTLLFEPMKVSKRNPMTAILKMATKQNGQNILRELYDSSNVYGKPDMSQTFGGGKTKPKRAYNFPHFSIYNFWTYDKNLLQDECPRNQAKVGRHCVYAPHIVT